MTNRIGAFILAGVLGGPAVVAAGPIGIYGASASAFTSVSTQPVLDNDGEVTTDNFLLAASASSTSGSAQWIASANASASYNELLDVFGLHAFAEALDMSPTSPEDFVSASAAAQWD